VSLGLVRCLDSVGIRVKFFKPIVQQGTDDSGQERSTELIKRVMNLNPPPPLPLNQVETLLSAGRREELMERIIELYEKSSQNADVLVVEGLLPTSEGQYMNQLNNDIAFSMGAEIILVAAPDKHQSLDEVADKLDIVSNNFGGIDHERVIGYIINKISQEDFIRLCPEAPAERFQGLPKFRWKAAEPIGYIPWDGEMSAPRTREIATHLKARILNEGDMDSRRVRSIALCARTAANIVHRLTPGALVIAPGDRDDIILASAMATMNGVPLAGLLLTNAIEPDANLAQFCSQAIRSEGLPIMITEHNSYMTASLLSNMSLEVPVSDLERIEWVMDSVANHLNSEWLKARIGTDFETRMSPPAFRYQLVKRSAKANKRIVLPGGNEPRTVKAATLCHERRIAQCILLGDRQEILDVAHSQGITLPPDLVIMEPQLIRSRYVEPMVQLRRHKGLSAPMAEAQLEDTVVLGTMMLALDEVDGLVSGAVHTTANTIRPAFQLIRNSPGCSVVSSVFFMLLPDQVLVYGDCAVNPDPSAEQLADIALQSAESAANFGIEPRVAMISYSTGTSGTGSEVEKVRKATELAKTQRPDLLIDGPLQYDAAAIKHVGLKKAPESQVAGRATVFIFPDLNTGNTTYKAVQRSADVISVGPRLQGLNKPVNDLSRGALVEDIVFTIALTAIQADTTL
jgi:phosphate acetyltransferase